MKNLFFSFIISLSMIFTLEYNPASLDFGEVVWGDSLTLVIDVTNPGDTVVEVLDIVPSLSDFTISPSSFQIFPGGFIPISVKYLPSSEGYIEETLAIMADDFAHMHAYPVSGTSVSLPIFEVSATEFDFDVIQAQDSLQVQTLTLTNHGYSDLEWSASSITEFAPESIIPGRGELNIAITGWNTSYEDDVYNALSYYANSYTYQGETLDYTYDIICESGCNGSQLEDAIEGYDVVIFPHESYMYLGNSWSENYDVLDHRSKANRIWEQGNSNLDYLI